MPRCTAALAPTLRSVALPLALLLASSTGCGPIDGGEGAPTRVTLRTRARVEPEALATFTTGFGWSVTLTRAAVAVESLYYFAGAPPTVRRTPTTRERLVGLLIGTAWAHPGHYQSGTALGEVRVSPARELDLDLAGGGFVELPDGDGLTGTYRSASFSLPTVPPPGAALGGHLAVAEGAAVRSGSTSAAPVYFRLVADVDDVAAGVHGGAIDGCPFDAVDVSESGTVTVEVKPSIWLELVDFDRLPPSTGASPVEAHDVGFSQGVTRLSAYRFTYAR